MNRLHTTTVVLVYVLATMLPAGATVGDTGSYVERISPDGVYEIKAWIEVATTGSHFFTVFVDADGNVKSVCTEPDPVPQGGLNSTDGATDTVATWTIELLKRKGHGRARAGFWSSASGQRLAEQLEAELRLPKCGGI